MAKGWSKPRNEFQSLLEGSLGGLVGYWSHSVYCLLRSVCKFIQWHTYDLCISLHVYHSSVKSHKTKDKNYSKILRTPLVLRDQKEEAAPCPHRVNGTSVCCGGGCILH